MEILGYSERGIINALFYDILNSPTPTTLISDLLNLTIFINKKEEVEFNISECKVLIEQSFSDFGDSDVLLLVENSGKKQAIFLEAKVKTYSGKWDIVKEFTKFKDLKGKDRNGNKIIPTSNLFTQLYFKNRLFLELGKKNRNGLDLGIKFNNTTKSPRKIGKNEIVQKAVDHLSEYIDESFYLGIIPNTQAEIKTFIKKCFIPSQSKLKTNLTAWNKTNWGFLTWEDIETFLTWENRKKEKKRKKRKKSLNSTCKVFDFNKDKNNSQIY